MRMCSRKGCIMSCIRFQECKFIKREVVKFMSQTFYLRNGLYYRAFQSYQFYNTISITINFVAYDC